MYPQGVRQEGRGKGGGKALGATAIKATHDDGVGTLLGEQMDAHDGSMMSASSL